MSTMSTANPPDVIGWELAEARSLLAAAGWAIGDIILTRPPHCRADEDYVGSVRVVRLRQIGEHQVSITVVRDGQGREG